MWDREQLAQEAAAAMSRYVQIDTTNPPGAERIAADWLKAQLAQRGVSEDVAYWGPDTASRPILVARVPGSESLKPLIVNHHMDVVPADPADWSHAPFGGEIAEGYVWGRGTLDTKGLGIMFLLALEGLLRDGVQFRRPVVFLAVPDEEAGGSAGMGWLAKHAMERLDPEWMWDEGGAMLEGMLPDGPLAGIAVAEKRIAQYRLKARGKAGHGSMPHNEVAPETLVRAMARLPQRKVRMNPVSRTMFSAIGAAMPGMQGKLLQRLENPLVRAVAAGKLTASPLMNAMLRDTISMTQLEAGYKINVIPEAAEAGIDCRLLPDTDPDEFEAWLSEHLDDDRVELERQEQSAKADIAPIEGPFFDAVRGALAECKPGAVVVPMQMPGGSDARFFRQQGIPAYGFAPYAIDQAEMARVHGVDERISIDNLVLGVEVCSRVIRTLCT